MSSLSHSPYMETLLYWSKKKIPHKFLFLITKFIEMRAFKKNAAPTPNDKEACQNYTAFNNPIKNNITEKASIAVIVPYYVSKKKSAEHVQCLARNLSFEQTLPADNIIFVDDYSPVKIDFSDFPKIHYYKLEKNSGPATARNTGLVEALKSKYEIIAFTDSDCIPSKTWLKEIKAFFIHNRLCMDNYWSGNKRNIQNLFENPDFEFIRQDVIKPYDFYVDEIYNLACSASPFQYQKDSIFTFKTCIFGAINALNLADKWHAKVLQASTSEIYGDALEHPQRESYWGNVNCNGVRSCYDEGKRGAETLFCDYYRQHQTKIKIIRIFNTYGPHMLEHDGRVVSSFITAALKNDDIQIYGKGIQTRSFNYISDLIEAFLLVMKTDDSITMPINIGNPDEINIHELANIIIKKKQIVKVKLYIKNCHPMIQNSENRIFLWQFQL